MTMPLVLTTMLMISMSPSQLVQIIRSLQEWDIPVSMATAELSSVTEYSALATTNVHALEGITVLGTTDVGAMERGFV